MYSMLTSSQRLAEATLRPRQAGEEGTANRPLDKGKAKAKGTGRARTPLPMDAGGKKKLKMAMKQRKVASENMRKRDWCYLYVGNVRACD